MILYLIAVVISWVILWPVLRKDWRGPGTYDFFMALLVCLILGAAWPVTLLVLAVEAVDSLRKRYMRGNYR